MEIRETIEKDLNQLAWLFRQNYNGDSKIVTNTDLMLDKFKKLINDKNYKFISVVDNDELIGFCSVVINEDFLGELKPIIMVWHLRVSPKYRKQGVGSKLLRYVEDFGKSINADYICLSTDKDNYGAHEFYRKNDYQESPCFYKYL